MLSHPPLAGRYGIAVALALLALCPYIVLSTASQALTPLLVRDLGTSRADLVLVDGLSNAGYAVGAVVAAYLAQKLLSRRLFLLYEVIFVLGSVLAAAAPDIAVFGAGRVLQGVGTGLLLVSALPPLVTRFGPGRLPLTVAIVDIGLFGATTVGPLAGGPVAASGHWRLLLAALAVAGVLGFLAGLVGYAPFEPPDPRLRLDRVVFPLAVAATFLPFFGTSSVGRVGFTSPVFFLPLALGLFALAALVVIEYRKDDPLLPVKALSTQLPVTGTVVAMIAGAVFIAVLQLVQLFLADVAKQGPIHAASLFWPLPVGLLVATAAFGLLFRTRFVPVLANAGLVALIVGTVMLLGLSPSSPGSTVEWASLALGFGAGATVSPGLFLAALGVPSTQIGRAFALVELLRSEAAFAVAPVAASVAQSQSDLRHGVDIALYAMVGLGVAGLLASLAIPYFSGARLRRPDVAAWLDRGEQALPTPTTLALVRPAVHDETAEGLLPRRRSTN